MRLLVIDQGRLLSLLVRHDLSPEIEVDSASSLAAAERLVDERAPDAIVVSVPPGHLPWREFHHHCSTHVPPIPVLFESSEHAHSDDLGLDPDDPAPLFVSKPAGRDELRAALERLLERSPGPARIAKSESA